MRKRRCNTNPNSDLGEIGPVGDALPGRGVRVAFAVLERGLELTQLDAGELTALAANTATLL